MRTDLKGAKQGGAKGREKRQRVVSALVESPLDLLVVGGGIVGAGIVRDAAMRGLRAGLIEQNDFASGTSSRSSRLLHGGMRYLAQGRLKLVREASVEKKIIHRIAPHLSEPLAFIFPSYRGDADWALWKLKIGVKIYDLLCGGHNFGKSTWLNSSEGLSSVADLRAEGLQGAVRYYDGFTNDARLVLDTLRSAERAGGFLLNYCRLEHARRNDCWECGLQDQLTGKGVQVAAKAVANATGPWAGHVPHSRVKLRLTKGSHIVVNRSRLPVPDTVVMTESKRILFAIPWGERTIIGTTDEDYAGPAGHVRAEPHEIRYLLDVTNRYFPKVQLSEVDVISTWAGLRPLIAHPSGEPSDISRSHQIRNPEPGWWDVAGGKLTTYRLMAEQTVDRIVSSLKRSKMLDREIRPCTTAREALLRPEETNGVSGILPPECSRQLVEHFCSREWAVHLDDVMLRRAGWEFYSDDAAGIAERTADWMAEFQGWSIDQRAAELDRYHLLTGKSHQIEQPAAV